MIIRAHSSHTYARQTERAAREILARHNLQKSTASLRASPTSFERTIGVTSSTDSDVDCVLSQSSATSSSKRFPAANDGISVIPWNFAIFFTWRLKGESAPLHSANWSHSLSGSRKRGREGGRMWRGGRRRSYLRLSSVHKFGLRRLERQSAKKSRLPCFALKSRASCCTAHACTTFEHVGQLVLEQDEPRQLLQSVLLGRGLGVVHLDKVYPGDVAVVVDLLQRFEVEVGLSRLAVICKLSS